MKLCLQQFHLRSHHGALISFFFSFFLDVQIEFEGIKYTPVEDDNEVRNDDDDKVQEQNEQDAAELS